MKFVSAIFGLAMLAMAAIPSAHADRIGVRSIVVPVPERGVQIDVRLWYSAAAGGRSVLIGDNAVFRGAPAFQDAQVASGAHPLILLSLGGLRAAPDLDSWIASQLAARGFIVAVPRRPGPRDLHAAEAPRELWLRPADLSATLTALQRDPFWAGTIDTARVGALGFQLGSMRRLTRDPAIRAGRDWIAPGSRRTASTSTASTLSSWNARTWIGASRRSSPSIRSLPPLSAPIALPASPFPSTSSISADRSSCCPRWMPRPLLRPSQRRDTKRCWTRRALTRSANANPKALRFCATRATTGVFATAERWREHGFTTSWRK
jgi:hypothetical protein